MFGKMEYDDESRGQTNVQAAAGTGGGILGSIAMATVPHSFQNQLLLVVWQF